MEVAATIAPSRVTRQLPRHPARAQNEFIKSSQEQNATRRRPMSCRSDSRHPDYTERATALRARRAFGRGNPPPPAGGGGGKRQMKHPYRQNQELPVFPVT